MNSQLLNVPSRPPPLSKKNTMRLLSNFTRLITEFQVMYSKKRSNSSSAPTSFRTTIFPPAMSVNFPIYQHACTRHAVARHQSIPDATSLWQPTQSHLGTLSWHDNQNRSTNPLGRQDQTCKLVVPQKSTTVSLANLWGILPWQRSLQC